MIPVAQEIPKPEKPVLPNPDPIKTLPVEWKVLIVEGGSIIALDPKQYEILSQNMAEIMRWVKEASWRLKYYANDPTN